jgi:uncharacterized Zn finger protein
MGKRKTTLAERLKKANLWQNLTWDDLAEWAGGRSVSRGRTYQRQGRVKNLGMAVDGRLLADVHGGQRYVVTVRRADDSPRDALLTSECTCPVGADGCKHAVAVVAEFLDRLTNGTAVPVAEEDDPRWDILEHGAAEFDDDLDDDSEDLEDDPQDQVDDFDDLVPKRPPRKSRRVSRSRRTPQAWQALIEEHIRAKGREDLATLVVSLTARYPELREEFQERISLGEGDVDRLVAQARQEMRKVAAEPGWSDHWHGGGNIPDYTRFRRRLERLVELGHPDAVVELGREFIELGSAQVEQSNDEGETLEAVASCYPVIFAALAQSSLRPHEQVLFAVDVSLSDDWGSLAEAAGAILDAEWEPAVWSQVADRLEARLSGKPPRDARDEFSRDYRRDVLSGWLSRALEKAGRSGEVRRLYEAEARQSNSYERLVRYLLTEGELDDACRWAREGIERTAPKYPGIASQLAATLCDVARQRKQWDVVAAHAAHQFFEHPGAESLKTLLAEARKAKCESQVRAQALHFLETGTLPFRNVGGKGKSQASRLEPLPDWPLPVPEELAGEHYSDWVTKPHYDVLLSMAIADKRPDDVLHWYDKLTGGRPSATAGRHGSWGHGNDYSQRVAEAVAQTHPERSIEIYMHGVNAHLQHASPQAYDAVARNLKLLRPILEAQGREQEWTDLVARLREEYKRRKLFVEALDRLEQRPIVKTQRRHSR